MSGPCPLPPAAPSPYFTPDGNLILPGSATATGDITGNSDLFIKGKATVGSLEVKTDSVVNGKSLVKGSQTVEVDQSVAGKQNVGGDQSVGGKQNVGGDQSVGGNQSVGGKQSVGDDQSVAGKQEVGGDAHFSKNVTIDGITNLNGGLLVNNGPIQLAGDLYFEGTAEFDGHFKVNGLNVSPEINHVFTSTNPDRNFVIPGEPGSEEGKIIVDKHKFKVLERRLRSSSTIPDPFATAPIDMGANPPGTIANPPGTVTLDILDFTIVNIPSTGPWYFGEAGVDPQFRYIDDDPTQIVLRAGLPETFIPGGSSNDRQPPTDQTTMQINITINQATTTASMDLFIRYSTEAGYDFARVLLNGLPLFSRAGTGPNVNNPYLAATIPVIFQTGDTLSIIFNKDQFYYEGIDMIYFFIRNLQYTNLIANTANFFIVRNNQILRNLGYLMPLNGSAIDVPRTLILQFEYEPGDLIAFRPDTSVYSTYRVLYIATR